MQEKHVDRFFDFVDAWSKPIAIWAMIFAALYFSPATIHGSRIIRAQGHQQTGSTKLVRQTEHGTQVTSRLKSQIGNTLRL